MELIAEARDVWQVFIQGLSGASRRFVIRSVITAVLAGSCVAAGAQTEEFALTHAEAAQVFACHSGLFDRYISPDADLNECLTFLNRQGIFFDLMKVVNGSEFTLEDCARVMGQISLRLSGEAKWLVGKVKLPKEIDSWKEYCKLNGVDYEAGYKRIVIVRNRLRNS